MRNTAALTRGTVAASLAIGKATIGRSSTSCYFANSESTSASGTQ